MSGKLPSMSAAARASSMVLTVRDRATSRPILIIACLNNSRSSPLEIASGLAPIISTPYFSRIPFLWSSIDRFSAVCPPSVGSRADGRSAAMIFSRNSRVSGSMYVTSANSGSVIIVAGLEFTRITR
jgi:hypothetical protein